MKRFLKPTGRILTTAVFTSAAFETLIPNTAVPTPIPDSPLPDSEGYGTPESRTPEKASTVIPPEAVSTQEFTPPPFEDAGIPQIDLQPFVPEVSARIEEPTEPWEAELVETSPSLPPLQFALHDTYALGSPMDHLIAATPREHNQQSSARPQVNADSDSQVLSSLSNNAPSLPDSIDLASFNTPSASPRGSEETIRRESTAMSASQRNSDAAASPDVQSGSQPSDTFQVGNNRAGNNPAGNHQAADAYSTDMRSEEPLDRSSASSEHSVNDELSEDVMAATREWLDETLSQIVRRDQMNRESQLRDNLLMSAEDYLAQGQVDQVHRIADNPALTEADRDELLAAIADSEATHSSTYPFVSAEHARSITRRAVRQHPLPSQDWLLSQMNTVVANLNPSCEPDGNSLFSSSGTNTTRFSPSATSQYNTFLSGGAFLAGVGHQPPSASDKSGMPPINSHRQTARQQRDCTPTIGQNIGGLTGATLSGYQWLNRSSSRGGSALRMVLPLAVPATITSRFGWRIHPIYGNRRFHFGIDFGAPMGTPILAAMPGRVETSHYLDGYGLTVILENQDLEQRTLYAHMSGIAVEPGTWVEQGDVIGWVGSTGNSTGPHLHFEVHQRQGNDWVAVDPLHAAAQLIANRRSSRIP